MSLKMPIRFWVSLNIVSIPNPRPLALSEGGEMSGEDCDEDPDDALFATGGIVYLCCRSSISVAESFRSNEMKCSNFVFDPSLEEPSVDELVLACFGNDEYLGESGVGCRALFELLLGCAELTAFSSG